MDYTINTHVKDRMYIKQLARDGVMPLWLTNGSVTRNGRRVFSNAIINAVGLTFLASLGFWGFFKMQPPGGALAGRLYIKSLPKIEKVANMALVFIPITAAMLISSRVFYDVKGTK